MDERRLAELIELYLDNDLSVADAVELRGYVSENPAHISTVLTATQSHVLCRTALRPSDPQLLAQRAQQLLAALPSERRQKAASQVMRRINRRRSIHFWSRWGIVAAAVLVLIYLQPWYWHTAFHAEPAGPTDGTLPHIIALTGTVRDQHGQQLQIGQSLADHVLLQTSAASSVTMLWPDGTSITVDAQSRCEQKSAQQQRLHLITGRMQAQVAHRQPTQALLITTPDATTQVIGTRFDLAVEHGRSTLHVSEGLVRFKRMADGVTALVGAGEHVSTAYLPPPASCLSNEQLAALKKAITAGRQPWAHAWESMNKYLPVWATEPVTTPEVMTIYSWANERPQHVVARNIYGNAARNTLGLALSARLSDNRSHAQQALKRIRAWLRVPLAGPDADFVAMDTSTVFIQAADLIRRTGMWTDSDDALMETFIQQQIESRIPAMQSSSRQRARWRAITARMLIAGWRGDRTSIRQAMQELVDDCATTITPQSLQQLHDENEGTILHTMNQAMMAADVARTAGITIAPPDNFQLALTSIVDEIDNGVNADIRHGLIDPVIYGVPPWRLPLTTPLAAGPSAINRVAFSWYFPTMLGLDPRLVP